APSTDSSASRFCGGTGADDGTEASWATSALVKRPSPSGQNRRKRSASAGITEHTFEHYPQKRPRRPQQNRSCSIEVVATSGNFVTPSTALCREMWTGRVAAGRDE